MTNNNKITSGQPARSMPIPIAKNWWILFLFSAFFLGSSLFMSWIITYPAIQAAQSGQPPPADWSWTSIIVVDCVLACVTLVGHWYPWAELRTEFTEEGISRPILFGHRMMLWNTVTRVGVLVSSGVNIIEIWSGKHRVKINPLYYKDSDKLFAVIREYAPASAFN